MPLLLTVLIVYPVAEGHPVRWSRLQEDLLLGVEAARWAGFGIALHLVLPRLAAGRLGQAPRQPEEQAERQPSRSLRETRGQ
ncbi:MAG: hypothetical protein ACR2M3_11910 [Thermomicrobiales bacterium]